MTDTVMIPEFNFKKKAGIEVEHLEE